MGAEKAVKQKRIGSDLTEGPVFRLLLTFAIPMILTNLIQQLYGMVDLMIIGKYVGTIGTVGVSTGGELSDLMTPVANGLAAAGQIYIAQLVGARQQERVKRAVGTLLTLVILVSFAFTVSAMVFFKGILTLLNCPGEAFGAASRYMLITALGMPFIFGYNAICSILRGMGESKRPLLFVCVAASVNVVLDWLLVAVIPLGEVGTAVATVASQVGAFLAAFLYLYHRRDQMGFSLSRAYFHMNAHDLAVILKLGIPQMVRVLCVQGSMLWVKSNVNYYGLVAASTYSIGNKIEKFMNVFINGVDQAGGAMIGQNLGARKHKRIYEIMRKMVAVALTMGLIAAALFLTIPDLLYGMFTSDAEVIAYGHVFLRIMAVGCIVVSLSGCFKSISTGAGAAGLSLALGILDGVCRILVCLFLFYVLDQGVPSYFWGAGLCQLIPGFTAFLYFVSGRWKTKKLL